MINLLLQNGIIKEEEKDIYEYAIFVLLFNGSAILISLLIATMMHRFWFAFVFYLVYTPLRMMIGGYHCKSPWVCFPLFLILTTFVIWLFSYHVFSTMLLLIVLMLCFIYLNQLHFTYYSLITVLLALIPASLPAIVAAYVFLAVLNTIRA